MRKSTSGVVKKKVNELMESSRAEFESWESLRVFTGTWNVRAADPEALCNDIVDWLLTETGGGDGGLGVNNLFRNDLIVIALQEIVNLDNPYNMTYLGDITTYQYHNQWGEVLKRAINDKVRSNNKRQYDLTASSNLVGMSLFVFAAADLCKGHTATATATATNTTTTTTTNGSTSGARNRITISDIRTFSYGCGFMNVSGNKGAVGVSLTIGDSPLVFINSHLHSGDKATDAQKRNEDYFKIIQNATFTAGSTPPPMSVYGNSHERHPSPQEAHNTHTAHKTEKTVDIGSDDPSDSDISDWVQSTLQWTPSWRRGYAAALAPIRPVLDPLHETVFWLGDLNYRLKLDPLPKSILLGTTTTTGTGGSSPSSNSPKGSDGVVQVQLDIGDLPLELMEENVSNDSSSFRLTMHDVLFHVDSGRKGLELLSERDELRFEIAQARRSMPFTVPYTEPTPISTSSASAFAEDTGTGIGKSIDVAKEKEKEKEKQKQKQEPSLLLWDRFEEGALSFPPTYKYQTHQKDPQLQFPVLEHHSQTQNAGVRSDSLSLASMADILTMHSGMSMYGDEDEDEDEDKGISSDSRGTSMDENADAGGGGVWHDVDDRDIVNSSLPGTNTDGGRSGRNISARGGRGYTPYMEEYQRPRDYSEYYLARNARIKEGQGAKDKDKEKEKLKETEVTRSIVKSSTKMRVPAWTDRILWRDASSKVQYSHTQTGTGTGKELETGNKTVQLCYERVREIWGSDHKLVRSRFDVQIRVVDEDKEMAVRKQVREELIVWTRAHPEISLAGTSTSTHDDNVNEDGLLSTAGAFAWDIGAGAFYGIVGLVSGSADEGSDNEEGERINV